MHRRQFIRLALASSVLPVLPRSKAGAAAGEIPRRALGKTGVKVSAIGLGGYHLGKASSDDEAIRIVDTWLITPMTEARYIRRLMKVRRLEDSF